MKSLNLDIAKFQFQIIPDNRYWMRDHGATYVINGKGEKKVVDFGWTLYGNKEWLENYYEGNKIVLIFTIKEPWEKLEWLIPLWEQLII